MTAGSADTRAWQAFERKYQAQSDPWDFAASSYELRRYQTILGALAPGAYRCIYEPGCSVGVLTRQLSARAARVVATDFAPSAVQQARKRCAGLSNVELVVADVRHYRPTPPPDLIVFSEIGYYFHLPDLRNLGFFLAEQLAPQGQLLAAHWLGHSKDHALHGDEVHEQLRSALPLVWLYGACYEDFRIDCWRRR
jgi:trans-aconitate methyltransferase